jgi:hypothetical protein
VRAAGKMIYRNPVKYAHLIELGRKMVRAKGNGLDLGGAPPLRRVVRRSVKAAPAKPFLRPAFAATKGQMEAAVEQTLAAAVKRAGG